MRKENIDLTIRYRWMILEDGKIILPDEVGTYRHYKTLNDFYPNEEEAKDGLKEYISNGGGNQDYVLIKTFAPVGQYFN